jgi:hypothetical protein
MRPVRRSAIRLAGRDGPPNVGGRVSTRDGLDSTEFHRRKMSGKRIGNRLFACRTMV